MGYNQGKVNNFASALGWCTFWAAQRYYDQTGIWVPWNGNANQWYTGALANGWQVSDTPPKGIPSIICLQPDAGQGLTAAGLGLQFGHVGAVEQVNNNNTVLTSNMHWDVGPIMEWYEGYAIRYVTFTLGHGVSFLWADNKAKAVHGVGSFSAGNGPVAQTLTLALNTVQQVNLMPNATVVQTLVDIDNYLQITNPLDVDASKIQDTVLGFSFTDPAKYVIAVSINMWNDFRAVALRSILLFLGIFLLYKVLSHFIDFAGISQQIGGTASNVLSAIGPVLAA